MSGEASRLGPFNGGMNTLSDPSAVADSELVDCLNFELDLDGSLQSRPPIVERGTGPTGTTARILGFFIGPTGTAYLLASNDGGTWYYDGTSWTLITATVSASSFVQYQDKAWLVPPVGASAPGGSWSPTDVFTAVAAIPQGSAAIVHKERMWVAPGNSARIKFSNPGDLTVWDANNFFDVNAGDGEKAIDLRSYQGSILIFRTDSTYQFSYESDPGRGQVSSISQTVGTTSDDCQVAYENVIFVYHEGNVYEMVNYTFTRVNFKVPFQFESAAPGSYVTPVSLSIFGDRLVVRYYDRIYVFGLRTRTWTRWSSNRYFGKLLEVPSNALNNTTPTFYAGSILSNVQKIYQVIDGFDNTNTEAMTCSVRTKNYDYQVSQGYKRLYWWGIDVIASNEVNAVATPITYGAEVRWSDLAAFTWAQLAGNSWAQPLVPNLQVESVVDATAGAIRKFIKLYKSMRFRQIFYEASIMTDGKSASGQPPVRLFNFITVVGTRQAVSKTIS